MEIVKNAYNESGLTFRQAEKLNSQPEKVKRKIIDLIKDLSCLTDVHEREQVESVYQYPGQYTQRSITEQIEIFEKYFPKINLDQVKAFYHPLPVYADDYFVIPHWELIAGTYVEAVEKVLFVFQSIFNCVPFSFKNLIVRQTNDGKRLFDKIINLFPSSKAIVLPAQLGAYRKGCSFWRAQELFMENECGPGIYGTLMMIITHPERVEWKDDLMIIVSGDEICYRGEHFEVYSNCLFISKAGEQIKFDVEYCGRFYNNYGPTSAFLI